MMKRIILSFACFCVSMLAFAQYVPSAENLQNRKQFAEDRFGVFLHWGLYSMFAQGEWYMQNAPIHRDEYAKSMNAFYPHDFDAYKWVRAIKDAGAKYICFTTRHHEGFSMWDTKWSDYNIMHTPYGKDIVRQLADACHEEGIALHLYYSHLDWLRDDYPIGRTGHGCGKDTLAADYDHYVNFMEGQLQELLTKYSPVRCVWFDGWWDHDSDSIPFDWQLQRQYTFIHDIAPECLIGNNHHQVPFEGEDIQIFERDVPGENKAGLSGQSYENNLPLETCQTMNGMWGYKVIDQDYKSPQELIQLLVRTSGKGANLLLNIGPQSDGNLPATALERLKAMGEWLRANGETIYGTHAGPFQNGEQWVTTQKDNKIWLHVFDVCVETVDVPLVQKVKSVNLRNGERVQWSQKKGNLIIQTSSKSSDIDNIYEISLK